jgi:hypothetical protein
MSAAPIKKRWYDMRFEPEPSAFVDNQVGPSTSASSVNDE